MIVGLTTLIHRWVRTAPMASTCSGSGPKFSAPLCRYVASSVGLGYLCKLLSKEVVEPVGKNEDKKQEDEPESASESDDSDDSLLTALAAATITESPWRSAPSYPPLYLSTVFEYLPPQPKPRLPQGVKVEDLGDDDKKDKDIGWAKETYENSLEVDQVFEKFTKRVAYEGEQCVRSVIFYLRNA